MTDVLPTGRRGQALAVGLLLAVLAMAWLVVAAPLLDWYAERAAALEGRVTLERRMAQVAAGLPALRQAAAAAAAASPASGPAAAKLLEGSTDAVAGAALVQLVQDMAGRTGATLSSTETLPAEPAGTGAAAAARRIGVRVALSAPWPVLVRLLRAVATASPAMLVDDLQVHGGGARWAGAPEEPPLDAQFVVLGFRAP